MEQAKTRDRTVDAVRGIAILLVMTGHCITVNTVGAEKTAFYNIIWSLQMPLFFLVSGYVNRYSKAPENRRSFFAYIKKRTVSYMLPFAVWTIIRTIIIGGSSGGIIPFLKTLSFHMDSWYWFLWALWVICLIYGAASFAAHKLSEKPTGVILYTCVISIALAGIPLGLGIVFGMNFFAAKLILYYLPFYYIGYLLSAADAHTDKHAVAAKKVKELFYVPAVFAYLFVVFHKNLYSAGDTVVNSVIRFMTSLFGCFIVFFIIRSVTAAKNDSKTIAIFSLIGQKSLEMYLAHYLFLSLIKEKSTPAFLSTEGILVCVLNFTVMLFFTVLLVTVFSRNRYCRFLLFGKRTERTFNYKTKENEEVREA